MPTLYVVGTPIGNMEDMTYRAVRVLQTVALVAAEDTRHAKGLFTRYDVKTPLVSYHEQGSQAGKLAMLLRRLAEEDIALISDAGMPSISDPGFALVRGALEQGSKVEVIPGPSAVTTAIVASGLASDQFLFLGFLPRTRGPRRAFLAQVRDLPYSLVVLESPHRITESLKDIAFALGDRQLAVCREMTKLHEEVHRGTVSSAIQHFTEPRGEFTLVIEGQTAAPAAATDKDIEAQLGRLLAQGLTPKGAIVRVALETGRPKREVYRLHVGLKG